MIKKNILLAPGKLSNKILDDLLLKHKINDSSIIVGPSVGEDTAAVDIVGHEVLVIKSDPITFATDKIGYHAVLVNSNDIATSGANPKWMLSTLLLPPNTSINKVNEIFQELNDTCSDCNIILCGGHTEITDAVSRPIVVGSVIGTVKRKNLINKKNIETDDVIIMTKSAAIEGTAIIASEFEQLLLKKGMSTSEISECLQFRSQISILNEAKIARQNSGVTALHDVTEGGVLTALKELSKASGLGMRIFLDDIFIHHKTEKICDLMNINAFGLIGSGSLLICCKKDSVNLLINNIRDTGIRAEIVGKMTIKGGIVEAIEAGKICKMPHFEVDEMNKLFQQ